MGVFSPMTRENTSHQYVALTDVSSHQFIILNYSLWRAVSLSLNLSVLGDAPEEAIQEDEIVIPHALWQKYIASPGHCTR
jgi:hypothetical protein